MRCPENRQRTAGDRFRTINIILLSARPPVMSAPPVDSATAPKASRSVAIQAPLGVQGYETVRPGASHPLSRIKLSQPKPSCCAPACCQGTPCPLQLLSTIASKCAARTALSSHCTDRVGSICTRPFRLGTRRMARSPFMRIAIPDPARGLGG